MKDRKKTKEKVLRTLLSDFESIGISVIPPDSKAAIKKIEKRIGPLNDTLKNFYSRCDGYTINWQGNLDGFKLQGQTSIRPVSILDNLGIGNNKVLSFSKLEQTVDFSIDSLMVFDIIDNLGNYVLLQINDGDYSLYLYTYHKKLNKINLTIAEYLLKAEEYFGTELWQQFYIENPDNISNFYAIYKKNKTAFFKHLLEDNDYKYVKDVIEALNDTFDISKIKYNHKHAISGNLEALQKHGAFQLLECKIGSNVSCNSLMKAQESICKALPESLMDFYAQINGLEIEWNLDDISGKLNYLCLEEIFGGNKWYNESNWSKTNHHSSIMWIGENDDHEFHKISRSLRPLEIFSGDSGYVGFKYGNANEFELYYAFNRDELMKLPITVEKYLRLSIRLLGLEGWQEYYRLGKQAKIGGDYLIDHINKIFPDFKIEEFKN